MFKVLVLTSRTLNGLGPGWPGGGGGGGNTSICVYYLSDRKIFTDTPKVKSKAWIKRKQQK